MCEKNFEGMIMSLSPKDDDDINEEIIIDNEIDDEIDDAVVRLSKRRKRSKKKKKICKSCDQDTISLKERDSMRYKNKYDQELAKEYCEEHERMHRGDTCKPYWCGDCGYLIRYDIEIDHDKVDYDK